MIINGDAQTVLKRMDDECIHMAVTSSPYYGLRSYGTEPVVWDGDPNCQHEWISKPTIRKGSTNGRELSTLVSAGSEKTLATGNSNTIGKTKQFRSDASNFCSKCGAWKGELGQEPTPELFVKHLTTIFHELKRVLRNDGIFWMNIGDSYSGSHGNGYKQSLQTTNGAYSSDKNYDLAKQNNRNDGNCKPKDLIGIPWMLAFSMRADGAASPQTMYTVEKIKSSLLQDYDTWNDVPKHTKRTIEDLDEEWLKASKGGWYLRADIPWVKRSAMPSSVTDRPGSSIEHVFLFSKSQKYYYDHIATMQLSSESYNKDKRPRGVIRQKVNENTKYDRNNPQYAKFETIADGLVALVPKQDGTGNNTYTGFNDRYEPNGLGLRYMRDSDFFFKTWQGLLHNEDGEPMALVVNPKGYKGAHFAAFPIRLVEPLILAGTSEKGVCPKCGAPWVRITKKESYITRPTIGNDNQKGKLNIGISQGLERTGGHVACNVETIDWKPTCTCNLDPIPATVLDPFSGSSATGVACKLHNRNYIGIELNPEYVKLGEQRIKEGK